MIWEISPRLLERESETILNNWFWGGGKARYLFKIVPVFFCRYVNNNYLVTLLLLVVAIAYSTALLLVAEKIHFEFCINWYWWNKLRKGVNKKDWLFREHVPKAPPPFSTPLGDKKKRKVDFFLSFFMRISLEPVHADSGENTEKWV